MTWATDVNYGGEYTHVYGGGAACDGAGYSFYPNSWWSTRLSSYLVHSGCNKSFARGDRGNAGFTGDVPWVGSTLNDDVDYIKIWRGERTGSTSPIMAAATAGGGVPKWPPS
jgi:hypothetical protein